MKRSVLEFLLVAFPKALSGFGTVAINLLLLRFLGTEQYGILGICLAAILLIDSIVGSAVDMGVLKLAPAHRASNPAAGEAVQRAGFYWKAAAVFLFLLLSAVFARPLSEAFFHRPDLGHLLYLVCAASAGLLWLRSAQLQWQIEGRFSLYGMADLLHSGLRFGGIALLMATRSVQPESVLAWHVIAPAAILAGWAFTASRGVFSSLAVGREPMRELSSCVPWYLLTFGLGALLSRMDLFLLARWSNLGEVGIYAAALTIAMIVQMVGVYLSVVTSPKVVPMIQEGRFCRFFRTFQTGLLAVCLAGYLLFRVVWAAGASRLLPGEYARSGELIHILIAGAFAGLATFPVTMTFVMFVRPRFLLAMDCVYLPVLLLLYAWLIPLHGAVGAAWVTAGANISRALIAQAFAWKWASEAAVGASGELLLKPDWGELKRSECERLW